MSKPKVFISYAHKGDQGFTPRLAFALGFYADIFWDQRLQAGPWMPQLQKAIKECDFFLVVLSYSQTYESGTCKEELRIALEYRRSIIPIQLHEEFEFQQAAQVDYLNGIDFLEGSDFSKGFDKGFHDLTNVIFSRPLLPWEVYSDPKHANLEFLTQELQKGHIPGTVSKEFSEWIIVERLWTFLEAYLSSFLYPLLFGHPRTPEGVVANFQPIYEQLSELRHFAGINLAKEVRDIAQLYDQIDACDDHEHALIGGRANEIVEKARKLITKHHAKERSFEKLVELRMYFDFDMVEKLRELIRAHARRARQLY